MMQTTRARGHTRDAHSALRAWECSRSYPHEGFLKNSFSFVSVDESHSF